MVQDEYGAQDGYDILMTSQGLINQQTSIAICWWIPNSLCLRRRKSLQENWSPPRSLRQFTREALARPGQRPNQSCHSARACLVQFRFWFGGGRGGSKVAWCGQLPSQSGRLRLSIMKIRMGSHSLGFPSGDFSGPSCGKSRQAAAAFAGGVLPGSDAWRGHGCVKRQ